jgi:hypothetical protein
MTFLGHNNGPSMEPGYGWRKHSWAKARADLLPSLPIEVLRTRVKRAKALGLPYKTYASIRAASGHDVVGFMFSNNALRAIRNVSELPEERRARLAGCAASFAALVHRPLDPALLAQSLQDRGIDVTAARAPHFADRWSDIARAVAIPLHQADLPRDGVLVVGETVFEQEWSQAGRLAGFLSADQFFAASNA